MGIFYHPKFDYESTNTYYTIKTGYPSTHQFAVDRVTQGSTVLDIGCGPGYMAEELEKKSTKTISIDRYVGEVAEQYSFKAIQADVEAIDTNYYHLWTRFSCLILSSICVHQKNYCNP